MSVTTAVHAAPLPCDEVPESRPSAPARRSPARNRPRTRRRPKIGAVGHAASRTACAAEAPVLTRRGVLLVRVSGVLAATLIGFGLWQGLQPMAPQVIGARTVTVLPGQSVWAIAESVHPEIDPRITVDLIEEVNGLRSASLVRPGAVLTVPVFERDDGATRR